ncbi:MAG TPA: copper-binding protein [Oxalobacteraceae bacterium]|jgi:Cu(I)/Ag(I) efflux system protein CusF|nr:copper-binding protein [Oxalobacteraceae bacterium]HCN91198.1 copper-binding protein [Oxalobacteraceae bacterium]
MKLTSIFPTIAIMLASSYAIAQSGAMNPDHVNLQAMHASGPAPVAPASATRHQATGVVKAIDPANGRVTLAHQAIKSLNWPAMTMDFAVKDKVLFDKLAVGKKVDVELMKQGSGYVVTAVK